MRWHKDPVSNDLWAGPYIAGKNKYMVFIRVPALEVIFWSKNKSVVFDRVNNIRVAKVLAKNELMKLGARFYDEVRNKV